MNVYIIEDEANIRQHIISLVEALPYLQVVGYSGEIAKAKMDIPALNPDLILADIQLDDGNSFTLFEQIDMDDVQLIFITAYDQFAIDALNLGAFAYLLKPLDTELFNQTLERCFRQRERFRFDRSQMNLTSNHYAQQQPVDRIVLKHLDFVQIISVSDIMYCRSDKGYTSFCLRDGEKIVVSKVLKEYESLLPDDTFIRCHQSYLINVRHLKKLYKDGQAEMANGDVIPVSDRKKQALIDWIEGIV